MANKIRRALNSPATLAGVIPALIAWAVTAASVAGYLG